MLSLPGFQGLSNCLSEKRSSAEHYTGYPIVLAKPLQFLEDSMSMRTDVDHLPTAKQRELERVVETIFDEFRGATENAPGPRKGARILKLH